MTAARKPKTYHRLSPAGDAAGLPSGASEAALLELSGRPGLVLTTEQLMDRTSLARNTTTIACGRLCELGLVEQVGRFNRSYTWVATADGRALAELIREAATGPSATAARPEPAEPDIQPPSPSRDAKEHAIWRWCWSLTRDQVGTWSHALVDDMFRLLDQNGELR